jgi:hypothetical protein
MTTLKEDKFMTRAKKITKVGTKLGLANRFKAQVIERRPGHKDEGKVVFETPFAPNLILETGMTAIAATTICSIFPYACIGTSSTPTEVDSGSVTATTSGTICTSNSGFFNSGMVGQLIYFPGTGQSAIIASYSSTTQVTLATTLSPAVSSGIVFSIYAVNQTGLGAEVHRTNTYLTGTGNCGTTYSDGVYTHQLTYDFPIETEDQTYYEVGFSASGSSGNNLNMRGILSSAPVSVVIGQQVRLIYYVLVTVTPISPRARTVPISGWPALAYPVAFTESSSVINLTGMSGYSFPRNSQVFFDGTLNPGGITFGQTYYANPAGTDEAGTVSVSATSSGSPISCSSTGTDVDLYTNTTGNEQLCNHQFSGLNTSGGAINFGTDNGNSVGEPSTGKNMLILTDDNALPTFPTPTFASGGSIPTGGQQAMSASSYVAGSYQLVWSTTFSVENGNSNAIMKLATQDTSSSQEGLVYLFNFPQQKTNLYTLTISWVYTWGRIFV